MDNIPMTPYQGAQEIDLLICEMQLIGGPRASFEIIMIDTMQQPEVVVSYDGEKPIYTLMIPRGLRGESVRGMVQRKTSAEWIDLNPILMEGELGYETDTRFLKVGNGNDPWTELEYMYENASELGSGLLSPANLVKLINAAEVTSNLDLGDTVALFENNLL